MSRKVEDKQNNKEGSPFGLVIASVVCKICFHILSKFKMFQKTVQIWKHKLCENFSSKNNILSTNISTKPMFLFLFLQKNFCHKKKKEKKKQHTHTHTQNIVL